MVRALDQFERRQVVFRAAVTDPPRQQDPAQIRTLATAAALVIVVLFISLTGGWQTLFDHPFFAYIAAGFVTSWSLWLFTSLWRQFRARSDSEGVT